MKKDQEVRNQYVKIFKSLPREVVAVSTDPELRGRGTDIAQAALLVSFGHAMGWIENAR